MSYENLEQIHKYGIDVDKREIYLIGEESLSDLTAYEEPGIEYVMSNRFIKNFNYLENISPEPIFVHMKTCGGIWEEGIAIYDVIKNSKCPTTILSYTHARSMSSIILQAADHRILMPSSYFLYHLGTIELSGEAKTIFSVIERSKYDNETMINIYIDSIQKHSKKYKGKDKNYIRKKIISEMDKKGDVYLTPQEAIDMGFADEIFNEKIKKRSGKDTIADIIIEEFSDMKFIKYKFAKALKDSLRKIFLWTLEQIEGPQKETVDEYWGISPRQAMQVMGTEMFRELLPNLFEEFEKTTGKDIWVKRFSKWYDTCASSKNVVISDVRFLNEADMIKSKGGLLIKVVRDVDNKSVKDKHPSEIELDKIDCDYLIKNYGTLEDLIEAVKKLFFEEITI